MPLGYLDRMFAKRLLPGLLICALAPALIASNALGSTRKHRHGHSLLQSRNLWATIDICNPPDKPETVGVRGSMPSDGHPRDALYMRFQLQSLNPSTHQWVTIGPSADSGFLPVGSAALTRQGGRSFEFKPASKSFTVRGLVEFQWRRAGRAVHDASRTTSGGHTSLAGADPPNFSAATCTLR